MPRQVDYPRASLASSLELADAVSAFGGSCTAELAAERMNRKLGGAFAALIGAAVKYGLVTHKGGKLNTTPLYKALKLSYTDEERSGFLRQAFLSTPLFREIEQRFAGDRLPVEHFEKMLIREFEVPQEIASRVAGYFLEGARQARLIDDDGVLLPTSDDPSPNAAEIEPNSSAAISDSLGPTEVSPPGSYTVRITGPGLDSTITIGDPEDLVIVQAFLKKVERALGRSWIDASPDQEF